MSILEDALELHSASDSLTREHVIHHELILAVLEHVIQQNDSRDDLGIVRAVLTPFQPALPDLELGLQFVVREVATAPSHHDQVVLLVYSEVLHAGFLDLPDLWDGQLQQFRLLDIGLITIEDVNIGEVVAQEVFGQVPDPAGHVERSPLLEVGERLDQLLDQF